jgi:hypothetical protein
MALEGPPFLSSSIFILSTTTTSITIGLVLCQRRFLLHEVISPGIMVCVTLIIKTIECMHLIPFISNNCLDLTLAHLTMFGGLTGCPSKPVSVGFGLPLGGISEKPSSAPIIVPLFHLVSRSPIPFHLSRHWVDLFSGLHLISWEEGAKGPEGKSKLVKDKSLKIKPRDASPRDP